MALAARALAGKGRVELYCVVGVVAGVGESWWWW